MMKSTILPACIALGLTVGACDRPASAEKTRPAVANPNPVPAPGPPQWMVVRTVSDLTFAITTPTQKVGEYRRIWLASIPVGKQSYSTTLYEFDCAQDRARTLQENEFADKSGANRVEAVKNPEWLYPDPDLVIYHVLSHACGREVLAGAKFSSIKALLEERSTLLKSGESKGAAD